jgi:hypothetical protein
VCVEKPARLGYSSAQRVASVRRDCPPPELRGVDWVLLVRRAGTAADDVQSRNCHVYSHRHARSAHLPAWARGDNLACHSWGTAQARRRSTMARNRRGAATTSPTSQAHTASSRGCNLHNRRDGQLPSHLRGVESRPTATSSDNISRSHHPKVYHPSPPSQAVPATGRQLYKWTVTVTSLPRMRLLLPELLLRRRGGSCASRHAESDQASTCSRGKKKGI